MNSYNQSKQKKAEWKKKEFKFTACLSQSLSFLPSYKSIKQQNIRSSSNAPEDSKDAVEFADMFHVCKSQQPP